MSEPASDDERSKALVHEHAQRLLDELMRARNEDPSARMVGLILERGASQLEALRALAPELDMSASGYCGVVPREVALALITTSSPAGLDWLFDEGAPPRMLMPVLVCLAGGMRTVGVPYILSEI